MNAAAQPSSPRSIYRPIRFADRSWTTTTTTTAGSVYRRALNEGLRCDCDAAATSAAMQTRGAAVQRRPSRYQRVKVTVDAALLPPARWHNACPLKSVHSIRATIIEVATHHLDATIGKSVSRRRHSRFSNCTWQLFARMITGIISRFQTTWPWDYELNLFLYWTPTVYHLQTEKSCSHHRGLTRTSGLDCLQRGWKGLKGGGGGGGQKIDVKIYVLIWGWS